MAAAGAGSSGQPANLPPVSGQISQTPIPDINEPLATGKIVISPPEGNKITVTVRVHNKEWTEMKRAGTLTDAEKQQHEAQITLEFKVGTKTEEILGYVRALQKLFKQFTGTEAGKLAERINAGNIPTSTTFQRRDESSGKWVDEVTVLLFPPKTAGDPYSVMSVYNDGKNKGKTFELIFPPDKFPTMKDITNALAYYVYGMAGKGGTDVICRVLDINNQWTKWRTPFAGYHDQQAIIAKKMLPTGPGASKRERDKAVAEQLDRIAIEGRHVGTTTTTTQATTPAQPASTPTPVPPSPSSGSSVTFAPLTPGEQMRLSAAAAAGTAGSVLNVEPVRPPNNP